MSSEWHRFMADGVRAGKSSVELVTEWEQRRRGADAVPDEVIIREILPESARERFDRLLAERDAAKETSDGLYLAVQMVEKARAADEATLTRYREEREQGCGDIDGKTWLDDAQALKEAAEHVGGRYPGAASLMRRAATRLYQCCGTPKVVAEDTSLRYREALEAICHTNDYGQWIAVYSAAGGGYEGLQAIARAALDGPKEEAAKRPAGTDGMGEPASAGTACRDTLKSVQSLDGPKEEKLPPHEEGHP